ncbi:MAG TPA: hypothetical protein P5121_05165 [Caldilineaceae bacterium]|nr:hypothetical protein [Caldilineaceae bacterium]
MVGGTLSVLLLFGTPIVLVLLAVSSCANSVSDTVVGWRAAGAQIVESREQTTRVEIITEAQTEQLGIVVDAVVEMNESDNQTKERTNGWGLAHRMFDRTTLLLVVLCLGLGGYAWRQARAV